MVASFMYRNIYDFITAKEADYLKPIELEEGWNWSLKEHLRRSFLYLNSQFEDDNEDRTLRPNKNIVLAILNVQLRTLDIDVKDIELFVDDKDEYYKSHLSRKYHEKWAYDNKIDTFIDDLIYSYAIYGGVLVKNVGKKKPIVVNLRDLAFCSQRSILDYPFAIKHSLTASELKEMDKWGLDESGASMDVETLIAKMQQEEKEEIDIYEVIGDASNWSGKKELQVNIVSFFKGENEKNVGVTLFSKKLPKLNFKYLKRDRVEHRAVGRGGIEELFEPQIWTNWNEIKITEMMEAASKIIGLTDDPKFAQKHPTGLKGLDNLSLVEVSEGKKGFWQADTFPRSLEKFNADNERWMTHAQRLGAGNEQALGDTPNAGTPFALYEAQQIEGKSLHVWRQGQIASFLDEIYMDWVLKYIQGEITNDVSFMADLSADEMMEIAEQVATNQTTRYMNKKVLNGEAILPGEEEEFKIKMLQDFGKGGSRKFIDILKDDFKDSPLAVRTNIKGKQKNMAQITDKMVSFVRQVLATPQIRQDPEMIKWTNGILENSGLSPIMFASMPQMEEANGKSTEALKGLSKNDEGNI